MKLDVFYQVKWQTRLFLEIHAGAGGKKAKIGLKCWEECILNGLQIKILVSS